MMIIMIMITGGWGGAWGALFWGAAGRFWAEAEASRLPAKLEGMLPEASSCSLTAYQ